MSRRNFGPSLKHSTSRLTSLTPLVGNAVQHRSTSDLSSLTDWCNNPRISFTHGRKTVAQTFQATEDPQWQEQAYNIVAALENPFPVYDASKGQFQNPDRLRRQMLMSAQLKLANANCSKKASDTSNCMATQTPVLSYDCNSHAANSSQHKSSSADGLPGIVALSSGAVFGQAGSPYGHYQSSNDNMQHQHLTFGNLDMVKHNSAGNIQNLGSMASPSAKREDSVFSNTPLQISAPYFHITSEESSIFPSMEVDDLNSILGKSHQFNSPRSKLSQEQFHQCYGSPNKPNAFSSITGRTVFSQLPSVQSTRVYIASENSMLFNSERCDQSKSSKNQWQFSLEHKILLAYTNYKNLNVSSGDYAVSYVHCLHSAVCFNHKCICERLILLLSHFDKCQSLECCVCCPVRDMCIPSASDQNFKSVNTALKERNDKDSGEPGFCLGNVLPPVNDLQPCPHFSDSESHPSKRVKLDDCFRPVASERGDASISAPSVGDPGSKGLPPLQQWHGSPVSITSGVVKAKLKPSANPTPDFRSIDQVGNINDITNITKVSSESRKVPDEELSVGHKFEGGSHVASEELCNDSGELSNVVENGLSTPESDCEEEIKQDNPTTIGVSLLECLTAEQVQEHISSLGPSAGLRMSKEGKGDMVVSSDDNASQPMPTLNENRCQLCKGDELLFALPSIYCSSCGARIKRNMTYYITSEDKSMPFCFCSSCYRLSQGGTIKCDMIELPKTKLNKKKNDDESKEPWVQCDTCKQWQHQICSLFNNERDVEGKAEYKCPRCYMKEIEAGEHVPLRKDVFLGSSDLPKSKLSDFLEQRLFRRLQQEREERAKASGKSCEEVPSAEELVVRVVLSVNKQLKVKKQFLEIFGDNYPAEFPHTSKVILLFQKIHGIDVCLFGMYAQEFGSDCRFPNQRCVYISYLDSVKYFKPETVTATGEALRTFVYHEILIGYFEYCKKRGFAACHLWNCPPMKGEDFMFYCHPENQKTPKSEKLRQWYHSMLKKAAEENIVVHTTNLYDKYFVPNGQSSSKITAARLPYFGSDYWSGTAEKVIKNIEQQNGAYSPGGVTNSTRKRTLKAMEHTEITGGATKDILLMQKLGQSIVHFKEDFIVVHLQFECSQCHEFILSGWRWSCSQCKNFQLCRRCNDAEQQSFHTLNGKERHLLMKVVVDDVPSNTREEDATFDNWLFTSRHTFLGECQNRHYQFDEFRRAKYSTMMILHHLGNPTVPPVPTCKICHQKIDAKGGDVCAACLNKKELLDILLHASQCRPADGETCSSPKCLSMKRLFFHTAKCPVTVRGGCSFCRKVWSILQLHSKSCRQADCCVPRCRDMKAHAGVDCASHTI